MENRIYFKTTLPKTLTLLFNILIFIIGVSVNNAFCTAFALYIAIIGVQLHFFVFEDTRDTNKISRFDLILSICSFFIILIAFVLRSAAH